ncbi:MAG: hypothetical protein CMP54_03455 [Flavobacteriales bacterium]|nr:hypothetical protein [Flavobacteriales bacterium]|tara:strand:+ start:71 stop:841 length:771 start_codon:yes stop_codon:yes gene_type:complete
MKILINIWTYWCFLATFLVFVFFLPINLILVFVFGKRGKEIFVRYNYYIGNLLLFLYGMRKEVIGSFPFTHNEPCVYIANHKSYLDVIIIASLIPHKIKYLGKAEVFDWPLVGLFARYSGQIPVKREDKKSRNKAYELMKESIDNGFSIILFPEGGWRNHGDESAPNPYGFNKEKLLNPFRNGAFRLAVDKTIPIVPIAFLNAGKRFSSKTMKLIPGTIKITVLDLLYVKKNDDPLQLNAQCYKMIHDALKTGEND